MHETNSWERKPMGPLERHVVLVTPEVPWNTGSIGRTCLGTDTLLHLVRPLGFSLDAKQVKRAGLDYWPKVRLKVWDSFDAFFEMMGPEPTEIALFTKNGDKVLWQMPDPDRLFLIFGSETQGLPDVLLNRFPHAHYHIPITEHIRSLNLSTAVGIALYESLRKHAPAHEWPKKSG